ncbi:MAG TPA: hypothetical protein VF898_14460 [Chloroflexota bacterium]
MSEPQDSQDRLQDRRSLGRGMWMSYWATGAVLAMLRVALFVRVYYHSISGTLSQVDRFVILSVLYAEWLLGLHTRIGELASGMPWHLLVWVSVVTIDSFLMATPILLVGWLVRRHR